MILLTNKNIRKAIKLWNKNKNKAIIKYGLIEKWDVSEITNMDKLFYNLQEFNENINEWNVSNVTIMSKMFYGAKTFNQNINNWNVSNVTNMCDMFYYASSFNQNINNWNVSNVTEPSSRLAKARRDKSRYLYINIFNDV